MQPMLLSQVLLSFLTIKAGCLLPVREMPCDEKEGRVTVVLVVILATDRNHEVAPVLECIAREVKKKQEQMILSRTVACTAGILSSPAPLPSSVLQAAAVCAQPHQRLTGFRMGTQTRKSFPVSTREEFPLIDGQQAWVEAKLCADEEPGRICLKVKAPKVGCITYTSVCGKYFPIITGYETMSHDRLIIAVMVEPCHGKK